MLAEKMDSELSDFDLKHFCDGNPVYCYYFRLPTLQATAQFSKIEVSLESLPKESPCTRTTLEKTSL